MKTGETSIPNGSRVMAEIGCTCGEIYEVICYTAGDGTYVPPGRACYVRPNLASSHRPLVEVRWTHHIETCAQTM